AISHLESRDAILADVFKELINIYYTISSLNIPIFGFQHHTLAAIEKHAHEFSNRMLGMLCYNLQQKLSEVLKKKYRTKNQVSFNFTNINLENASINIFFEEFGRDKILQVDIELSDFDIHDNDPVMKEFFDFNIFDQQNTIEEGSHSQQNTNNNDDWSIDNIF
ncbi:5662_t:CDS:2, partial [Cetraspora pellucida]